ncbi:MAG TPA: hypothetical protein DGD08_04440 [Gemmatimonas aurantiaca]|uniref:Uncharacterized protein n=2 Tax=Gemmatimonas aurantiaca TaxID=173480 RepID=A0A3D4V6K6_9BACT|nr:hypothetical protein [Gemmatimonas aurantiaca]BAH40530.1 hypothetical membrane protein [Gemmatimonas aurantiaca T-27]HCT56444.1 hypothetical protein [Gemmatimonas aurantiaca]
MNDLFKGELLRFRLWTAVAAILNVVVLGFLSSMVDMAQQPLLVYQVFGAVYGVVGALLGMYQMGTYRKPNQWLNLLHRPLHRWQIAGALSGASATLLLLATALPIALVALYQETMTARVVDLRHWLLPLAAWLIAVSSYVAGAYAMVSNRRYSFAAFLLPGLLVYAQASGVAMLGVQFALIAFLAAMLAVAFKPDTSAPPRNPAAVLAIALPVQLGAYFLVWMLGYGVEVAWTVTGTHPLNMPTPPKGGYTEAERADGKTMLLLGIERSREPEAALWREQIALSEVYTTHPLRNLPVQGSMTNLSPLELGDAENNVWMMYSHDRARFVTRGLRDQRRIGELGVGEEQAAFPAPTMPYGATYLYNAHAAYQYDSKQQRMFERFRLPAGEVMASPPEPAGDNIVMLSDRAAYFYPGREAMNGLDLLQPLMRVAMPGPVGHLGRMDVIELLDGYLVSYTYIWGVGSGELQHPFQQVLRVDGQGHAREVARRALSIDLPSVYINRNTWLSPVLRALSLGAQDLFAKKDSLRAKPQSIPMPVLWLAAVCCLLSLLGAVWLTGKQMHSTRGRWGWVLLCGVIGLPALASLWLMYPRRETLPVAA